MSPGAAQHHLPLAVLHRFAGVQIRQHAFRFGDRAEILGDQRERLVGIESAGDDQDGVVGLIVGAIESLQVADVDALDVGARAYRGLAVVVPIVGRCHHAFPQNVLRIVLAAFHFVADDRHFAVEIFLGDERIDHAVGFHRQYPVEVLVGRGERLVIVGAVEAGRAVEVHSALAQAVHDVAARRRALEHHMLKQMRHARLAVRLLARSDFVGDVDGGLGLARVREQQDLEAVGEPVLGDALDARALRHARRERGVRRDRSGSEADDEAGGEQIGGRMKQDAQRVASLRQS